MEQLTLDLVPPEPPGFDNFLPGRNLEAWQCLRALARGERAGGVVYLWGGTGLGKSHLLRAAVAAAWECGRSARYLALGQGENVSDSPGDELVALDDVGFATDAEQGMLFSLANRLRAEGGVLLAASPLPLGDLPLREDVRSRLGWGLAYELRPMSEEELPLALADHARSRGFRMPAEVIDYLLRHSRRDLRALLDILGALDRHSLTLKRPVTLPMLRDVIRAMEKQ